MESWITRYSMEDPQSPLVAHKAVSAPVNFVGRQVGWSPGGEWCVIDGVSSRSVAYFEETALSQGYSNNRGVGGGPRLSRRVLNYGARSTEGLQIVTLPWRRCKNCIERARGGAAAQLGDTKPTAREGCPDWAQSLGRCNAVEHTLDLPSVEGGPLFDLHPRLGCVVLLLLLLRDGFCTRWATGTLADTSHRAGCLQSSDGRGVVIELVCSLLLSKLKASLARGAMSRLAIRRTRGREKELKGGTSRRRDEACGRRGVPPVQCRPSTSPQTDSLRAAEENIEQTPAAPPEIVGPHEEPGVRRLRWGMDGWMDDDGPWIGWNWAEQDETGLGR
ncbi:hypothetical protein PCL_00010 [Purpureocillium lilacinum]|uniref:Uncharacterized protein n=1 Tax=Purpureocillium lilacinum TaxID=33203 RepID=A0A2U3DPA0_PURLI|nr:hypothetical protein PCL_00010 [Purpureocillium lilacinum]